MVLLLIPIYPFDKDVVYIFSLGIFMHSDHLKFSSYFYVDSMRHRKVIGG